MLNTVALSTQLVPFDIFLAPLHTDRVTENSENQFPDL